jgi:hypothetical protein
MLLRQFQPSPFIVANIPTNYFNVSSNPFLDFQSLPFRRGFMIRVINAYPAWRDKENHKKPQSGLTMSLSRLE